MTKRFITSGIAVAILIVSTPCLSQNKGVAVLAPSYEIFREGTQSEDGAEAVFNMVKHAVKDAGMNVTEQEKTDAALQTMSGSDASHCDNQACLKKIVESTGAWNAVSVAVVDKEAHFILTINYAVGEKLEAKVFGNRTSLMEDIYGNVEKILKTHAPKEEPKDPLPEDPKDPDPVDPPPPVTTEKTGLKPPVFYTSLAITGALAVSWGVVEIVGNKKTNDLTGQSAGTGFDSDVESLKTLRAVDGVLLGTALAGAVTTTILYFFTDTTDSDKKDGAEATAARPRFSTGPVDGGVMMTIHGSF